MIDRIFSLIAPNYCLVCRKIGSNLCDKCQLLICNKYNNDPVTDESVTSRTGKPLLVKCVAIRHDTLSTIMDDFKFHGVKENAQILSNITRQLASGWLSSMPSIMTNVPTSPNHIRQRGHDHSKLLAQMIARLCDLPYVDTMYSLKHDAQHLLNKSERLLISKKSPFVVLPGTTLDPDRRYVVVDDIFTTGSTMLACMDTLLAAGAKNVCGLSVLRQPLD